MYAWCGLLLCIHKCSQWNRHLIPFNLKIEATALSQSSARRKQQEQVVVAERVPRVLQDYAFPQASDITSSIVAPIVEANNFELRPALISFVEKD